MLSIDIERAKKNARQVIPVVVVPDFLNGKECNQLIRLASPDWAQDRLAGTGGKEVLQSPLQKPETLAVYRKMCGLIEWANESNFQFEKDLYLDGPPVLLRYEAERNGFRGWHVDGFTDDGDYTARKISMSIQLSAPSDYEGGDLKFISYHQPNEDLRGRGTAILFPSFEWHHVTRVTKGVRDALVLFACGTPFR